MALAFGLFTYARRRSQVEAALKQSERRLERAQKLEAVGRLAGGLAHDLNNYLAAIRSQGELLLRKSDDPGHPRQDGGGGRHGRQSLGADRQAARLRPPAAGPAPGGLAQRSRSPRCCRC